MNESDLIFDWNRTPGVSDRLLARRIDLNDETLRDGLQCPSAADPSIEQKKRLLRLMVDVGIASADIGLPGAGPRARKDVAELARFIVDEGLPIEPNCAARTLRADIEPIVEISQRVGRPIEAAAFIGSSPIRQYAEDWTLDDMLRATEDAVSFAVGEGIPVMYVTEDTTRAQPEALKALYGAAIRTGARRICIADTVGHATPDGARAVIAFIRDEVVAPSGEDVKIDWHGHRDRGLAVANALAAAQEGADRLHGTALGIGERCGNAEMDLLLVNLKLLGAHDGDLSMLEEYVTTAAESCGVPIAHNWPVFGKDAFRTATGVHAAAIIKAEKKGDAWLADRVYSSVPAGMVGLRQRIEISPMSGLSNVRYWLEHNGYAGATDDLRDHIFAEAKRRDRTFADHEVHAICAAYGARPEADPRA
jgi:2-isopropylmalate synthase